MAKSKVRPQNKHLRPAKPGEVRNPTGENGATKRRREFNAIGLDVMGRPVETSAGTIPGDEAIWLAMRNKAIKGDVAAATWVRDTLHGRPLVRQELTGADGGPVAFATFADWVRAAKSEAK